MSDTHETRFGVMMTPEADPFARGKRLMKRINALSDDEFEAQSLDISREWEGIRAHLTTDQVICILQLLKEHDEE